MGSHLERSSGELGEVAKQQLRRSELVLAVLDLPAKTFTQWQQGFIAALSLTESEVDAKLLELTLLPVPKLEGLTHA